MTAGRSRLLILVAAALLVRALVPAGWMPDFGSRGAIAMKICHGGAAVTKTIPLNDKRDKAAFSAGHCLFAGFDSAATLSSVSLPLDPLHLLASTFARKLAQWRIKRTYRHIPPGRAPPAFA